MAAVQSTTVLPNSAAATERRQAQQRLRDETFDRAMKRVHHGRSSRTDDHDDAVPQLVGHNTKMALEATPYSRRPRVTTFAKAGRGLEDPVMASTLNFRGRRPFLDLDSARFWEERHGQKLKHAQRDGSSTAGTFGNAPASASSKDFQKLGYIDSRQFEVQSNVREARKAASQQQRRGIHASRRRGPRGRQHRCTAPAMCRTTLFSFVSGYGAAGCVVGSSGGQYEPRSSGVLSHKTNEGGGGFGLDNANLGMGPHAVSKAYFGDRR